MRIATFNVNSVRVRLPILLSWLDEQKPDVVALQETKCEDHVFPVADFETAGYRCHVHGQKSYNGVALLSRSRLDDVQLGFGDPDWPEDCRIIHAVADGVRIVGTYVPNGTKVGSEKFAYKLAWFERLQKLLGDLCTDGTPLIWTGDINVAPEDKDVYDPVKLRGSVCFHPDEQAALERLKQELGLIECFRSHCAEEGQFSYWEFFLPNGFRRNLGWRIDHVYASPDIAGKCSACWIDKGPRALERPSDHTPVLADFDI